MSQSPGYRRLVAENQKLKARIAELERALQESVNLRIRAEREREGVA